MRLLKRTPKSIRQIVKGDRHSAGRRWKAAEKEMERFWSGLYDPNEFHHRVKHAQKYYEATLQATGSREAVRRHAIEKNAEARLMRAEKLKREREQKARRKQTKK